LRFFEKAPGWPAKCCVEKTKTGQLLILTNEGGWGSVGRMARKLRACFENISDGLAAGPGRLASLLLGYRFLSNMRPRRVRTVKSLPALRACLAIHSAALAIPFQIYFQNTLSEWNIPARFSQ
jgi:hypothetical protein